MANQDTKAFTVATDALIASVILQASRRLVVVAPALSCVVTDAIAQRSQTLHAEAITLVLDVDPEVYRLGYGEIGALETLQHLATAHGIALRRQPGVRIGLVIADDETLIYVPTPRLVEAGPNTHGAANAIRLHTAPHTIEADLGLGGGDRPPVGRTNLTVRDVESAKLDLGINPPQKFDLARKVKVFNAFIEFVELKVTGAEFSRRTITIPSYLLAVADERTREQLHATFRLVPPGDDLSGDAIEKDRHLYTKHFLRVIPKYGTVVLRRDKEQFLAGVGKLETAVEKFGLRVKTAIQARIDQNVTELTHSLLPALTERPPEEWIPSSREKLDKATVERHLKDDLRAAFGTADRLIGEMSVRCMFKGVTYELLNDPKFVAAANGAVPELQSLHHEFHAAHEAPDPDDDKAAPAAEKQSGASDRDPQRD
jgi:hypothetical protein